MGNSEFINYCKRFIMDYVNGTEYETESGFVPRINEYNIFVVWISKVLQNNKALLSTTTDGDTRYYEITYNGDEDCFYFDAYDKLINRRINRSGLYAKEEWL